MSKGWIKLKRSLIDFEWYEDHNTTRLLIHLLVSVNYTEKKWKGFSIQPGSMVLSWNTLSASSGLSVRQCRVSMKKLEECGEVVKQVTNRFQVVRLVKWAEIQNNEDEGDNQNVSQMTDKWQTDDRQMTTTKESKELKERKEGIYTFTNFKNDLLQYGFEKKLVDEWMKVRRMKKMVNSETAFKMFISQVEKTPIDKNEILKICVSSSWGGFNSTWIDKMIKEGSISKPTKKRKYDY